MSDYPYIETLINGMVSSENDRNAMKAIFKYHLQDIRFGQAVPTTAGGLPSKNFGGGFFSATTPATANQEFSVHHGFNNIPYLLLPVLPLSQVNASIVRLTVSRAADANYVYLKSPDVSQPLVLYIEGH